MKILSLTISKKLFFIFLINTIVTLAITGMVISSFFGLSETIEYNSKVFSKYKENLESLRTEQASLKGLTQGFYLNVNRNTIKDSLDKTTNSFANMSARFGELTEDKYKAIKAIKINDSTVGNKINELDKLKEILSNKINEIGENSKNILGSTGTINQMLPVFSDAFVSLNSSERQMKTKLRVATLNLVQSKQMTPADSRKLSKEFKKFMKNMTTNYNQLLEGRRTKAVINIKKVFEVEYKSFITGYKKLVNDKEDPALDITKEFYEIFNALNNVFINEINFIQNNELLAKDFTDLQKN